MKVEWDENKNYLNKQKHNLSFELAQHVFDDPHLISQPDHHRNYAEERWVNLGSIANLLIIVVIHTYRSNHNGEEIIRIISARKARKKEQEKYFKFIKTFA